MSEIGSEPATAAGVVKAYTDAVEEEGAEGKQVSPAEQEIIDQAWAEHNPNNDPALYQEMVARLAEAEVLGLVMEDAFATNKVLGQFDANASGYYDRGEVDAVLNGLSPTGDGSVVPTSGHTRLLAASMSQYFGVLDTADKNDKDFDDDDDGVWDENRVPDDVVSNWDVEQWIYDADGYLLEADKLKIFGQVSPDSGGPQYYQDLVSNILNKSVTYKDFEEVQAADLAATSPDQSLTPEQRHFVDYVLEHAGIANLGAFTDGSYPDLAPWLYQHVALGGMSFETAAAHVKALEAYNARQYPVDQTDLQTILTHADSAGVIENGLI